MMSQAVQESSFDAGSYGAIGGEWVKQQKWCLSRYVQVCMQQQILRKLQQIVKFVNNVKSSEKGGQEGPNKICEFWENCEFCQNCEKL